MHIRCPHCRSPIEVVDDQQLRDVTCPGCGSSFNLLPDETATCPLKHRTLGHFTLMDRIGVGAFGEVWAARDSELDRIVAVKLPRKDQLSADEAEIFLREARATACLSHPAIVAVHEVGRDGEQLFIVSDYVRGVTLADWLSGKRPTPKDAALLVAQLADAVQHAHDHGIIHRDLKPSNIMLDEIGQPHIMDFGLAKRETGEITMTMEGKILGTPAYMSPEQAQGAAHEADRRSDVYSLGVILFELLTGELPFRGNPRMLVHQVINDEPPSIRQFSGTLSRDLETIVSKCLEKPPSKRYGNAVDLADDLRRYLSGDPVEARPISRLERGWRWCKKNRVVALLGTVIVLLLSSGVVVSGYLASAAIGARNRADVESQEVTRLYEETNKQRDNLAQLVDRQRQQIYAADMNAAQRAWERNDVDLLGRLLDRHSSSERGFEWYYLARLWLNETQVPRWPVPYTVDHIARSPVGPLIAVTDAHGGLTFFDSTTWHSWNILPPQTVTWIDSEVVFSASGTFLAHRVGSQNEVTVWHIADPGHFDVTTLSSRTLPSRPGLRAMAAAPQGSVLTRAYADGVIEWFDLNQWSTVDAVETGYEWCSGPLVFSPDGHELALGIRDGIDGNVMVWDTTQKTIEHVLSGHRGPVLAIAYSPDGEFLATGGWDQKTLVWEMPSGKLKRSLGLARDQIRCLAFGSAGGESPVYLAAGSRDGSVQCWSVPEFDEVDVIRNFSCAYGLCFLGDGRCVYGGKDASLRVRSMPSASVTQRLRCLGGVRNVRFSPSGGLLAALSEDDRRVVWFWQWNSGKPTVAPSIHCDFNIVVMAFCGSDAVVVGDEDRCRVEIHSVRTGTLLRSFPEVPDRKIRCLAVSPNYASIAAGTTDGQIIVWDTASGHITCQEAAHAPDVTDICFCGDDQTLLTGGADKKIRLWNITREPGARELWTSPEQIDAISAVGCSQDGNTLAVGFWSVGAVIKLWDRPGYHERTLHGHNLAPNGIVFLQDGKTLVSSGADRTIRFWDLATGLPRLVIETDPGIVNAVAVSPDEMSVVAGCRDGYIRVFRRATESEAKRAVK